MGSPQTLSLYIDFFRRKRVRSVETFVPQIEKTSIHSVASDDSFVLGYI